MKVTEQNIRTANAIFAAIAAEKLSVAEAEEVLGYVRSTIAKAATVLPIVVAYENPES